MKETACVYSIFMPPLSAMKRWPANVKSTTSTVPAFPPGLSMVLRWIFSIRESGSSETYRFAASSASLLNHRQGEILDIGITPVGNGFDLSGGRRGGLCSGCCCDIHPHHFPVVTIGIFEAAAIHEAIILLRARISTTARTLRFADHIVHRGAAVGGKADQDLAGCLRVGNRFRGELTVFVVGQQHDVDGVGNDHAGRGIVA